MGVNERKILLRRELLEKRNNLGPQYWSDKSNRIIKSLKNLQVFKQAEIIHCYVSMNQRNEVNTHPLIQDLLTEGKRVLVPITGFETGELKHTELNTFDELVPNKWGVLEPENYMVSTQEPDVIVIPLLAADSQFNRLGYGKGFYDRFLKTTNATKIGLLFDDFLMDNIPVDYFDEKLDILITDKKILKRNIYQ